MSTEGTVVVLFCVATMTAIVVQRLRIPYTVALVIAGLALGALNLVEPPRLTRELLFTIFLPGLLFEAAFHLDRAALRQVWRSVLLLAVPGVVLSVVLTAALLYGAGAIGLEPGLSLRNAIIFGAIVAATDPVAVTALFREVGAPPRLATLVEAESLFNDGTGVVLLTVVLSLATTPGASAASAVPTFFVIAGGGLAIGGIVGFAITRIIRRVDDAMIEIALTMIAAFGAFALAEGLHLSGVLATVAAGIICAAHGRESGMTAESKHAAEIFWQYVGFALNSIVFLLIGVEVKPPALAGEWRAILVGCFAMLLARVMLVALLRVSMRRTSEAIPRTWSAILAWGGLRGALSMVLALSLPRELDGRDRLISMTVGAVVTSLLIQGLTMPMLVDRLLGRQTIVPPAHT